MGTAASANSEQLCFSNCMGANSDAALLGQAVTTPQTAAQQQACLVHCDLQQIDHRCLNVCVAGGGRNSTCLQSCTFIKPEMLLPQAAQRSTTHGQFSPPVPIGGAIVPFSGAAPLPGYTTPSKAISPTTAPLGPSTNYRCVAQCQQGGFAFGYCTQSCSY
jgi:hypothetical protein